LDHAQGRLLVLVDLRAEPAAKFREVIHQRNATPGSLLDQVNGPIEVPLLQKLPGQCTCMVKKPFTTRLDEDVLALAQRIAEAERRSITSAIEVALIEHAAKIGISAK
jgi:hypothetical protein